MSVPINYVTVVLIWTTTPLAVKWSNDSMSPIAAVSARMALALCFAIAVALLFNHIRLDFGKHWRLYVAASVGIFPNMPFVYWAAEYIPSGLISVLFGLSPFFMALLGQYLLKEKKLTLMQWAALAMAIVGLAVIFSQQINVGEHAVLGVMLMLCSVVLFSLSGVLVKRYHSGANPLQQLNGSLIIAMPGFIVCWYLVDGVLPTTVSPKTFYSIAYLAVVGSLLGFMAYFYLLKKISVASVALIPLITPALAVMLGVMVNDEPLSLNTVVGTIFIVAGLAVFNGLPVFLRKKELLR